MRLWEGRFEDTDGTWLRWCDREGKVIPTGTEWAESERQRVERAEQELKQLKEKLQALGIELPP